ncbi:hypothetical protein [Streptomyces sp. NBC_01304]|uniref:hypothetical protein n=1 Tax=Streptomyces sp. NBC_01304 TaxID=2903818 RepID=UPI002E10A3A9|nr:hypothetical protein OG430_03730 [Streptomyces sp. NBC_01304]
MQRLTRILPGAALALALCGCGDLGGGPGDDQGTRTTFVELGPYNGLPLPSPSGPPSSSGTPATSPSPTVTTPYIPPFRPGTGDLRPTRLGPHGHADRMYAHLETAQVNHLPQARKTLSAQPAKGEVGLAFVLSGCQNTGARLQVDGTTVSASLTGAENVDCDQAEYFLATFTIAANDLPDGWTLSHPAR